MLSAPLTISCVRGVQLVILAAFQSFVVFLSSRIPAFLIKLSVTY